VPIAPPPMLRPGVDRGTEKGGSGWGAGTAIDVAPPGGIGVEPIGTGILLVLGDRKIGLGVATPKSGDRLG
jgi:hypothetical protein